MKLANVSKRRKGFSLIELLVVVAIILALSSISITYVLQARIAANEAVALTHMRTIQNAEYIYFSTYDVGFSDTLAELGPPAGGAPADDTAADLIPADLADGVKAGYTFTYSPVGSPPAGGKKKKKKKKMKAQLFTMTADPQADGITGNYHYYVDESNLFRREWRATATINSGPVD